MSATTYLLLTIFGGSLGIHKFVEKKYKMGFLYLFTCGLFGIGWIVDVIKALQRFFKEEDPAKKKKFATAAGGIAIIYYCLGIISGLFAPASSNNSDETESESQIIATGSFETQMPEDSEITIATETLNDTEMIEDTQVTSSTEIMPDTQIVADTETAENTTISSESSPAISESVPASESPEVNSQSSQTENNTNTNAAGSSNNFNTYDNPEQQQTTANYVLNTNTKKIHIPTCSSVSRIAEKNYSTSTSSIDELLLQGYSECGICLK